MVGRTLGHYEILEPLGAGGMGEVYRAHDTTLKRDVAIKVLPEDLSADVERLARLEREAQLLAALNHPNIEVIHGLEESDGLRFMVLELIEGESLAEKLSRGRIEVDKALAIARQIAEALEAAHAKGIIHRDLKPGNVVITPEGQAKVLDFGLAKGVEAEGASPGTSPDITESPTMAAATQAGIILGTAAYMSPEQARGKPVDKRTDIWAFGCVLYEMLTGCRSFDGETVTDVLVAIVERDPDWSAVPDKAPPITQLLLRRCLEKDPYLRLHDIADARIEIVKAINEPEGSLPGVASVVVQSPPWRRVLPWGLAGVAIGAVVVGLALWILMRSAPVGPQPPIRYSIALPSDVGFTGTDRSAVAISPDGTHLVFSANEQLYVRAMHDLVPVPLRGAEGGGTPFFSPDGQWVGFWAEGEIRKVPLSGGSAQKLCDAANPWGPNWGANDRIVYGQGERGIWQVSANGGEPGQLIAVAQGERAHGPQLLPGGEWVLYTVRSGQTDADDKIVVQSLSTGAREMLIPAGRGARYLPTGHLAYTPFASGALMVRPFDLSLMELTGDAIQVVQSIWGADSGGAVHFSHSSGGTLAYLPGIWYSTVPRRLVWVDRAGKSQPVTDQLHRYRAPRLSPDGDRISLGIQDEDGWDIWILEVEEDILQRLTTEGRLNVYSTWTADGTRVTFSSDLGGTWDLYGKRADFSDQEAQLLLRSDVHIFPAAWLPDGQSLVFRENSTTMQRNILVLPFDDDGTPGTPVPVLATEFNERAAMLSPEGNWIAYVSDWSGQDEVYVRPFPGPGGRRVQVSDQGGREPLWGPDGREVFYRDGDRVIAVAVETEPSFEIQAREVLFEGAYWGEVDRTSYDIHPDGQRFLMVEELDSRESRQQINIVLNWFEELKRLVPGER